MVVVVDRQDADTALKTLRANGQEAFVLGDIRGGDKGVTL